MLLSAQGMARARCTQRQEWNPLPTPRAAALWPGGGGAPTGRVSLRSRQDNSLAFERERDGVSPHPVRAL